MSVLHKVHNTVVQGDVVEKAKERMPKLMD